MQEFQFSGAFGGIESIIVELQGLVLHRQIATEGRSSVARIKGRGV